MKKKILEMKNKQPVTITLPTLHADISVKGETISIKNISDTEVEVKIPNQDNVILTQYETINLETIEVKEESKKTITWVISNSK